MPRPPLHHPQPDHDQGHGQGAASASASGSGSGSESLWQRLSRLVSAAGERLERLRDLPASEVTAEMHAEIDRLYSEAAEVRAEIDRERSVGLAAAAHADLLGAAGWPGGVSAGNGGLPMPAYYGPGDPRRHVMAGRAGGWIAAAAGDRALSGPAREWVEGVTGGPDVTGSDGLHVPWLSPTPAPVAASTTGIWPDTIKTEAAYQPVFPLPEAMSTLGISPDPVRFGARRYGWIRSPSATAYTEGAAVTVEDVRADELDLAPIRVSAAVRVTYELAAVTPRAEMDLIVAVQAAIADEIERLVLVGSGTAPEPEGLVEALTAPADPAAASSYGAVASLAAGQVDGRYAARTSDVSVLLARAAWAYGSGLYQPSGGPSAVTRLGDEAGSVGVSAHLPAAASDVSLGIIRRGRREGAYALPVWPTIQVRLESDPRAATFGSGRVLIAHALMNWALPPTGSGRADFAIVKIHD